MVDAATPHDGPDVSFAVYLGSCDTHLVEVVLGSSLAKRVDCRWADKN